MVFEVPVVVTFIGVIGLVTWRGLKFARWWILCATLLAAFLTARRRPTHLYER